MRSPIRRLAHGLATLGGLLLGAGFFLLGKARGAKALHPRGEVLPGTVQRWGGPTPTGVAWLDEPGTDQVLVRLSRSVGLPGPSVDVLGMAVRVPVGEASFGDLLLATTGSGRIGRFLLRPARDYGAAAYGSLFPYRTESGALLLAALPSGGKSGRFDLAYARLTGPWLRFGTLAVADAVSTESDADVAFDPVLHLVPGLDTYDWAGQLRRFAYAASRRSRR